VQGLVVAIEIAQCDRLVDLQQQSEVGERGVVADHVERAVEQRQCRRDLAAHDRDDDQDVQRPPECPAVAGLLGRRQRLGGDLTGHADLTEIAVRPCLRNQQACAVGGGDAGQLERFGDRLQGLVRPAKQRPALRDDAVQVDEQVRVVDDGHRVGRDALRVPAVPGPEQGIREPAGEHGAALRRRRAACGRLLEKVDGGPGCLRHERGRGLGEPVQQDLVERTAAGLVRALQQLARDPVNRCARLGERACGISVPRRPDGSRNVVIERRPDERVPEREPVLAVPQHTCRAGLVDRDHQVGDPAAHHDRQVRHQELDAQQGRRLQQRAYFLWQEVEPVTDGGEQRVGDRAVGHLHDAGLGDAQSAGPGERFQQLGQVQRVSRRALDEAEQVLTRPPGRDRAHQPRDGMAGKPAQPDRVCLADRAPDHLELVPLRDGAHDADEQQCRSVDGPGEPFPHPDGGDVGPLQVVHDQDGRRRAAQLTDEGVHLLRRRGGGIRAGHLAAQQPQDRAQPRGAAAFPVPQRIE
jgi:hypothetical protein